MLNRSAVAWMAPGWTAHGLTLCLGLLLSPALRAAPAVTQTPPPRSGGSLTVLLGKAWGGDGRPLNATQLSITSGRISRLGAQHAPLGDASGGGTAVLDARELFVVPGFIDLRSSAGLSTRNEEGSETTPSLHALDLVDAGSIDFQRALASGVTTVVVSPGGRSVIGGLAAALKTDDRALAERLISREVALVVTLGSEPTFGNRLSRFQTPEGLYFRRPGTRMGVISEIRRAFLAARPDMPGPAQPGTAQMDAAQRDVLQRAQKGELPILWRAQVQQDILTAFRLTAELGLPRPILVNPIEGHRIPEIVAQARGAILGPTYESPRRLIEGIEGDDSREATPKILTDAGVNVAIGTGPDDPPDVLRDRAILAARAGLSPELTLASITGVPARLLGLESVGELVVGASGDLVLLDGPPLSPTSRVVAVVVDGRVAWCAPNASPAILALRAGVRAPELTP